MTLEEIGKLKVKDVEQVLLDRLILEEGEEATPEQLEAELVLYKEELVQAELNRIDAEEKAALLARLDAIDIRLAMYELGVELPNTSLYKKQLSEAKDEAQVAALEAAEVSYKDKEKVKEDAKKAKSNGVKAALAAISIDIEELKEALGL